MTNKTEFIYFTFWRFVFGNVMLQRMNNKLSALMVKGGGEERDVYSWEQTMKNCKYKFGGKWGKWREEKSASNSNG